MAKKPKTNTGGYVYSTDPNFSLEPENREPETLSPAQQKLRIVLETRHRAGKAVTVIEDFIGNQEQLEQLGRQLKNLCGTGGSVKDGLILIQGDHRDKILQWLLKNGYGQSKKKGG